MFVIECLSAASSLFVFVGFSVVRCLVRLCLRWFRVCFQRLMVLDFGLLVVCEWCSSLLVAVSIRKPERVGFTKPERVGYNNLKGFVLTYWTHPSIWVLTRCMLKRDFILVVLQGAVGTWILLPCWRSIHSP